jgi:hypothetical protein
MAIVPIAAAYALVLSIQAGADVTDWYVLEHRPHRARLRGRRDGWR